MPTLNVTIVTPMRNCQASVSPYFNRINQLIDHDYTILIGHGDSVDRTDRIIARCAVKRPFVRMVDCSHGGRSWGSVVNPERFQQLAYVMNTLWRQISSNADAVIVLDGDLIWEPETIIALINYLDRYPAISPMVMHGAHNTFYDTWAFRRGGVQFRQRYPYHPDIGSGCIRLDSSGGCIAMRGRLARALEWQADVVIGIGHQIYELGESLWLDPALSVIHP